ncbi:MAG: Ig-like domain-containing protein [Paludibacteraceae bacterium]|nr:Ig-like domain-containing protein [Paludibacteraceae bacterium]
MKYRHIILIIILAIFMASCKDETKVESISLDPSELTIAIGEERQIELTINPLSATKYNTKFWSSSDKNVATVDSKGNVTGIYAGTCTITATVGDKKAKCIVTVKTPTYKIQMDSAIIFDNGIDETTGASIKILRLYEKGLIIDSTGEAFGNGMIMNLHLYSQTTADALATGTYQIDESEKEYTAKPGKLITSEDVTYATGSFLGEYSDYGISVLFAVKGTIDITKNNDSFSIKCSMEGEKNEHMDIQWEGTPIVFRTDSASKVTELTYNSIATEDIITDDKSQTKHTKIIFECGEYQLSVLFRLPLSTQSGIPNGLYKSDLHDKSFTISDDESRLLKGNEIILIKQITMNVSDGNFDGSFTDFNGQIYTISKRKK